MEPVLPLFGGQHEVAAARRDVEGRVGQVGTRAGGALEGAPLLRVECAVEGVAPDELPVGGLFLDCGGAGRGRHGRGGREQ